WVFALLAWIILMYSFLTIAITKKDKPPIEKALDGSWLLLVVSVQSLVILFTLIADHLAIPLAVALFAALSAWLLGFLLYVALMTMILNRLLFYPLTAETTTPAYWIDAGASAISVVAGAALLNAI